MEEGGKEGGIEGGRTEGGREGGREGECNRMESTWYRWDELDSSQSHTFPCTLWCRAQRSSSS